NEAKLRHGGGGRRAGYDADVLALQTRIGEAADVVKRAVLAMYQRISRAIVMIGVEHQVVALSVTQYNVAALGEQGLADEASGLREPGVLDRQLELDSHDVGDLVLEPLAVVA